MCATSEKGATVSPNSIGYCTYWEYSLKRGNRLVLSLNSLCQIEEAVADKLKAKVVQAEEVRCPRPELGQIVDDCPRVLQVPSIVSLRANP